MPSLSCHVSAFNNGIHSLPPISVCVIRFKIVTKFMKHYMLILYYYFMLQFKRFNLSKCYLPALSATVASLDGDHPTTQKKLQCTSQCANIGRHSVPSLSQYDGMWYMWDTIGERTGEGSWIAHKVVGPGFEKYIFTAKLTYTIRKSLQKSRIRNIGRFNPLKKCYL